jgi:methanogenic corrinoid protein MtbC1
MKEQVQQQRTAQALYNQANDLASAALDYYCRFVEAQALRPGSTEEVRLRAELKGQLQALADAVMMNSAPLFEVHLTHLRQQQGSPDRDQRLFQQLDALKQVLSQRLPITEYIQAAGFLNAAMSQLQLPLAESDTKAAPSPPAAESAFARLATNYLDLLVAGQRAQAIELVVKKAKQGTDVRDLYEHVLMPAQREAGVRWHRGEINVAQEHYCTAATEQAIATLHQYLKPAPANGHRFLATTLAGDLHILPIRVVAEFLEADGWTSFYLGANTPLDNIWQAVVDYKIDLLVVGASMSHHVSIVRDLVAARTYVGGAENVRVLVGGQPFNADPALWQAVGADAYAPTAHDAVAVARRLLA